MQLIFIHLILNKTVKNLKNVTALTIMNKLK